MAARILAADDEERYLHLIKVNLESVGYKVTTSQNGTEALELVFSQNPDLVILDIMMPGMDGITLCERIRQFSNIPVIMLTARGEEQDRVKGLNAGADDYVTKPFSALELIARVKAVLRRTSNQEAVTQTRFFIHDNLKIDIARAEVWKENKPVYLSATEYKLLIQFANHVGHVLSAEDLLIAVWGPQYKDDKEILWVSIARLRQKLEDNPHSPQHILTRSGLGYYMPAGDEEIERE